MSKIIEAIEKEEMTRLLEEGKKIIPDFRPGDTLSLIHI